MGLEVMECCQHPQRPRASWPDAPGSLPWPLALLPSEILSILFPLVTLHVPMTGLHLLEGGYWVLFSSVGPSCFFSAYQCFGPRRTFNLMFNLGVT